MSMLGKAVFIAAREHMNVTDNGGHAYILHPMRIAMRLRTDNEELMSIAILHDVIEDSKVTFEELRSEGFSERVISALKLLTHHKGVSYDDYIEAMRYNLDALLIKREDLRDNSDIMRLKGVEDKDFDRMKKYHRSFIKIEQMIKDIRK